MFRFRVKAARGLALEIVKNRKLRATLITYCGGCEYEFEAPADRLDAVLGWYATCGTNYGDCTHVDYYGKIS